MERYIRPLSTVAAIGGIAWAIVFAVSNLPPAVANEQPMKTLLSTSTELFPPAFDIRNIYIDRDDVYRVEVDAGISLQPQSTRTVRKIGYGRSEFVTISTTSSGVYSSDAMLSPHVRYPGVHVERIEGAEAVAALFWRSLAQLQGGGWTGTPSADAASIVVIGPDGASRPFVPTPGLCLPAEGEAGC